jgi:hypothetical protein
MINVNQITSRLASMPDQALQQYAAMHKNDPYVMALALSESNRRKQMRQGAQMQAPQQPKVVDQEIAGMAQPMPEDTGIGQLPAPNMQSMAEGGIVAFEDGGEVPGYAEGTLTNLKKKYKQLKGYEFAGGPEMFEKALDAEGIRDPKQRAFLKSIHAQESDQALNAPTRDKSGAMGPMQVTKRAWTDVSGKGDPLNNRADPFENMRAGIRYATTGWEKSGGDPVLAGAYYYGGPGGFAKAQKGEGVAAAEDKGQTTLQYGKQVAARMPSMIPGISTAQAAPDISSQIPGQSVRAPSSTAQATPAPGITALPPDVSSQIPGQSVKAPALEPEGGFLSPGSFQRGAEALGLPRDVGRQAYTTLMAPTPLAPITTLPKVAGQSTGLAALGEKLYNKFVPAAGMSEKQIAAMRAETEAAKAAEAGGQLLPRLTPPAPPVPAGGPALPVTPGGQAVVQSAADLEKVRLANQATDQLAASQAAARTATETAKLPSAAERLQQASYIRESDEAARLMNRARAATNTKTGLQTATGVANAPPIETTGIQNLVPEETAAPDLSKNAADDIVKMLKKDTGATTPELKQQAANSGMDWNSFLVRFGLGLMAGKSPDALQNIGEAGLSALDAQIAAQKAKQTEAGGLADIEYKQAATKKAVAEADFIASGAKEKNLALQAEQLIAQKVKDLPVTSRMDANQLAIAENRIRQSVYQQLGIPLTMLTGAPAPAGGFSVVGSRPG